MLITTCTDGKKLKRRNVIASVEGTFEDAYGFAMHLWCHAGDEGIHMPGLEIWNDDGEPRKVLDINYCTHER